MSVLYIPWSRNLAQEEATCNSSAPVQWSSERMTARSQAHAAPWTTCSMSTRKVRARSRPGQMRPVRTSPNVLSPAELKALPQTMGVHSSYPVRLSQLNGRQHAIQSESRSAS